MQALGIAVAGDCPVIPFTVQNISGSRPSATPAVALVDVDRSIRRPLFVYTAIVQPPLLRADVVHEPLTKFLKSVQHCIRSGVNSDGLLTRPMAANGCS